MNKNWLLTGLAVAMIGAQVQVVAFDAPATLRDVRKEGDRLNELLLVSNESIKALGNAILRLQSNQKAIVDDLKAIVASVKALEAAKA
ncbi:MAG TPA: hypothetical protein VJJ83_01045 [Candidatus Babeliales bacterium]|nr:hypothetical protein [Candidatus Babeliales bacterium]